MPASYEHRKRMPQHLEEQQRQASRGTTMTRVYFDCDTTPPLRSKYVACSKVETAINKASRLIESVLSGQIGLYTGNPNLAEGFAGYVIKNAGDDPFFEPAPTEA